MNIAHAWCFQILTESREFIHKYDSFSGTEKPFLFIAFFFLPS